MGNYHDVMLFHFTHMNKGKYDFTATVDEIVKNAHFKGLDGDKAFKKEEAASAPAGSVTESDTSDKELAKTVYLWCQDRFDYYDKKDGYYTGDLHDDDVFNDAAEHFGKSKTEVKQLYDDGGVYIVRGE